MIYDDQTSSAMNYYEELGVSPEATEQEIRKAHRRLVKLMHPDAQPDQSMKMLAETQMRRLNSIVSTLLDGDQRREYDDQLRSAQSPRWQAQEGGSSWRGIPWWLASTAGAVVLTLAAVWLWADHVGNTFGRKPSQTLLIQPAENRPTASISPAPALPSPNDTDPIGASYTAPVVSPPATTPLPVPPESKGGVSAAVVNDPPPAKLEPKSEKRLERPADKPKPVVMAPIRPVVNAKQVTPPLENPKPPVVAANKTAPAPLTTTNHPTAPSAHDPKPAAKVSPLSASVKKSQMTSSAKSSTKTMAPATPKQSVAATPPKKVFSMPPGSLVAQVMPSRNTSNTLLPAPPHVSTQGNREDNVSSVTSSPLPSAVPPPVPTLTTSATPAAVVTGNPRDPLEGEWVYAPKEPERQRAGFYPPEFIDLKLFEAGDPGNLRGQYSAKYLVTDRPVSPEVSFQVVSVSKGSRRFMWQGSNGSHGTLSIDPIDERTIRVDWHTTSAVRGPSLTSGQATLVRRQ